MRTSGYILIFILFLSGISTAQNKITGTVSDAETGEKLSNVLIFIEDVQKSYFTNYKGEFDVTGLPDGYLGFQFSLVGYKNFSLKIDTKQVKEPLDVKLISAELTTDEIIVTETRIDKPYQSDKITFKDLQRDGTMNVSEAITKIPGVWQLSTGSGISKPVIRGLYGNRIGIMVNGIRFDNQQWQDEHGLVMSSDGIDNIEVIKGPRSLLYGPEAIGGVVNITHEKPAPVGTNMADLNTKFFTNTLGILADVGLKGAEKDFNWLVRFGGETHADYLDGNEDRIPETRFGGYTIKGAFGSHQGIWVGNLNYDYTRYTYGVLEEKEFAKELIKNETRFDRSFNGPHHNLNVHNIVLQNTFITGKSKYKVNLGYTYNRRQEIEGNDERFLPDSLQLGNLDMILRTNSFDGSWGYDINRFTNLVVGSQDFYQQNQNSGERRLIPNADVSSLSLTSILNYKKDKLGFEGGARFDRYHLTTEEYGVPDSIGYFPALERTFNSVNGSAGVLYWFNKHFLAKTNFSTGFRAPNLAELTSNGLHEGTFQYEIGNPNFESEQSYEGDLGLVLESKYVSFDIAGYNNRINNYIYLGQTTDTIQGYPVFQYYQSDATLRGLEADLDVKPFDWLGIRATYSTVHAKREDGEYLPLIPADKITLGAHVELENWKFFYNPYFELSTYSALKKTRLGENEVSVPGYTLLNAYFGCDLRFEKQLINISISCTNMLNKVYVDFMSRIKYIHTTIDGKTYNANNMGRNIVVAIKVPFQLSYN
ncbi:MAG: TonB-dependent receptor [Ignavibacteriae bacterium]|nr:TonB-dependent receptor [Ignavibacteriota bacterium]MCB9244089.1 TonB-dependent receptor [Ignavibacteriales bacterium]